ncbi:MAG: threonylcarbamoyl-AMP synthase [Anaerolineaceae bacterium]|nr:threonylcarbamoyl-AMP synthase [Anaerolineaceae bacterium]
MSKIITSIDPTAKYTIKKTLEKDGVVAIPTDTIYGISVNYGNANAIEKIYTIKKRRKDKALPILIGDLSHLNLVAKNISSNAEKLIAAFWPGALTIVLPKKENLPINLSEYDSIGIRMPDHQFTLELLQFCGPLATTSANISGRDNPTSILDVVMHMRYGVDLFVNGGKTAGDIPSTIVDCTTSEIKILREGAIPTNKIFEVIQ